MGLFDIFKRKKLRPEDQKVIDNFARTINEMNSAPPPKPITAEEYAAIRNAERDWFEKNYDFSSVESIAAIPEQKDLPRPPGDGVTGEVYYYLRYKAHICEEAGDIELAIACMRKSITLMQLKYGTAYGKEECYSFIRMLIRNGHSDEARSVKEYFDSYYHNGLDRARLQSFKAVCRQATELRTDLLLMMPQRSACPECAKFQGRVYSVSGKSKIFPPLPRVVLETGTIHPGCHHQFFPYIYNATRSNMDYTLQVHPLQNPRYGRNIVTFSNRPFVDDRTEESKQVAEASRFRQQTAKDNRRRCEEILIQRETEKRKDYQDYEWIKANFPDKCPSSPSGYRRMKTQNTKNYQTLKQLASEMGREI